MPKFLSKDELYRVIQRELPEGVYPDGPATAYYSTADSDSAAQVIATAYANLQTIYTNIFPQSAVEQLADHEIKVFGKLQDSTLTVLDRQQRILDQLRWQKTMNALDMLSIVKIAIGNQLIDIIEWNCDPNGVWVLDDSELGIGTYLGGFNAFVFNQNSLLCIPVAATLGITSQQLLDMQADAFTYEVLIYDYTLSTQERTILDQLLTRYEPARSTHYIRDGLNSADMIGGSN